MKEKAGVFVSIHKHGELRGCIGTFEPSRRNVAEEIIVNGISAATRDPRFEPVQAEELRGLEISVDVLTSPEPIESKEQLNPKSTAPSCSAAPGAACSCLTWKAWTPPNSR